MPDLPDNQLVLVVTGAQGEPLSALRMVLGGHRQLEIRKGDTVVMSSRMIPRQRQGHFKAHQRDVPHWRRGAVRKRTRYLASGHAQREELRDMLEGRAADAVCSPSTANISIL